MSGKSLSDYLSSFLSTDEQSSDPVSVVISSTREKKGALFAKIWLKLRTLAKSYGPTWLVLGITLATINFWTVFLILTLWVSDSTQLDSESSWFWSFLPSSITSTLSHSIQSFWGRFFITWALNRVTHPIRFWIALFLLKPLAPRLDPKLKAIYYKTHFKLKRFWASKRKSPHQSKEHHESEEDAWIEYQRQHIDGGEADAELEIGFSTTTSKRTGFTPSSSTPVPLHPHPPSPTTPPSTFISNPLPPLRTKEKAG